MTGKLNIKLHRAKVRSGASVSPARSQTSEENSSAAPDLSLLRKSIRTSVTGFAQARNVFDAGTSELKQLLSTECDIIYECRVCRNLFRSLANFISHKRIYCCEKFNSSLHPFFSNNNYMKEDLGTIIEHEEDFQDFLRNKDKSIQKQKSGLESENLGKKNVATKDLTSIIERLLNRTESENSSSNNHSDPEFPDKHHAKFQLIPDTKNAVYQNIYTDKLVPQDLIKDQVAELDRLISSNEAVLGPDGKLLNRDATSTSSSHCNGISKTKENKTVNGTSHDDLFCSICKINFSTQKTLKFHMKNKHAENRLVYPCPDCTDTFSNSWSVFRHLFKVHRKSTTHIRKHRESIQNKAYPINTTTLNTEKRKVIETVRDTISEQQRMDQENQAWIDNLEGDGDIPRCGGCGKRFERRAALSSHRQTCQLRKTAQNRINTNVQRRLMAKALNKESDDTLLPEPVLKIPKIDKPAEKKIEIKIRRDYNKSNPLSIRTSSPAVADEDTAMETTEHNGTSNLSSRIGENECDFIPIEFNNQDDSNLTETVKDCDDANVDVNTEKNNENINDINDDSNCVDSDLNFEDIRRICHDENLQSTSKACGQNTKSIPFKMDIPHVGELDSLTTESNCEGLDSSVGNGDNLPVNVVIKIEMDSNSLDPADVYQCEYCDSSFTSKTKLERHISRHLIWMKYECKICGIKSCNTSQYERHMKTQHKTIVQPHEQFSKQDSNYSYTSIEIKQDTTENIEMGEDSNQPDSFDDKKIKSDPDDDSVLALSCEKITLLNVKKYKPKPSYKVLKRKRRFMKKPQKANRKKIKLLQDSDPVYPRESISISKEETVPNDELDDKKDIISADSADSHKKTCIKISRIFREARNNADASYTKYNQHIASSESYTVRRPVRNKIKPFDKDFEYDSSYLPKIKAEPKEIPVTTVISQKPQLKRKQFLQSVNIPEEIIKPWEETDQSPQKEQQLTPKNYQGALQTISLRVASQGKALMKARQSMTTRRNTPLFFLNQFRPLVEATNTQKTASEKLSPAIVAQMLSHPGEAEKTVPPLKISKMKLVQPHSTVSKTSEKSYSDKIQRNIGTPTNQKSTDSPKRMEKSASSSLSGIRKKKIIQDSQTLPTKIAKMMMYDHQALTKKESYQIKELTMLNKSQYKPQLHEREPESPNSSLSILPANGKSNSKAFVNISLKQLKNLHKEGSLSSEKNVKKNISALKNLEENNEIRISKVVSLDESDSEKGLILQTINRQLKMKKYLDKSPKPKKYQKLNYVDSEFLLTKKDNQFSDICTTSIVNESDDKRDSTLTNIYDDENKSCEISFNLEVSEVNPLKLLLKNKKKNHNGIFKTETDVDFDQETVLNFTNDISKEHADIAHYKIIDSSIDSDGSFNCNG